MNTSEQKTIMTTARENSDIGTLKTDVAVLKESITMTTNKTKATL